jgi:hypothetical protein
MGKSGGGGGGSSGSVTWPPYFMDWHDGMLGESLSLSTTMVAVMNNALTSGGGNPFTGVVAYDPTTFLTSMATAIDNELVAVAAIVPATEYSQNLALAKVALEAYVFSTTELAAAETAFNAVIDADYNNAALPRFQRGMQDINAVISSSYVTGAALLSAEVVRKKAQFSSELRLQSYREKTTALQNVTGQIVQRAQAINSLTHQLINTKVETLRIAIVGYGEQTKENSRIDEMEAKWDMDVFIHGGQVLASGQGGIGTGTGIKATPMQSALGGALSGAAAGGMAGYGIASATGIAATGPIGWGIGIGALLGGAMGLFG